MRDLPRQRWLEAEPERLERERQEMAKLAPQMHWVELDGVGHVIRAEPDQLIRRAEALSVLAR